MGFLGGGGGVGVGLIFDPGIFMGLAGSPKEFFWGFDFASIRSSPSLEIRSTSPLPGNCHD